jgi:hypothetical protein
VRGNGGERRGTAGNGSARVAKRRFVQRRRPDVANFAATLFVTHCRTFSTASPASASSAGGGVGGGADGGARLLVSRPMPGQSA